MKKITILILLVSNIVNASLDDQKRIFRLCHSQLTKERPDATDTLYQEVANGQKTGAEACIELVNSVQLDADWKIPMANDGKVDYRKQTIFQTIFDIHHGGFVPMTGIHEIYKWADHYGTYKLVDEAEMAYHFTLPFVSDLPFQSALTNDMALKGVRYSEFETQFPFDHIFNKHWQSSYLFNGPVDLKAAGSGDFVTIPAVDQGLLVGIKPAQEVMLPFQYAAQTSVSMNSYGHFGGGAIGSQPYVMLTAQSGYPAFQGGVLSNMPRNFAVSIMREFMCRDLPVLRSEDITDFVDTTSPVTFHQNGKCMRCHATIDPIAYTRGNLMNLRVETKTNKAGWVSVDGEGNFVYRYPNTISAMMVAKRPLTKPNFNPEGALLQTDNDSHSKSRPVGHLRMRSAVTGALIEQQVEGIAELAQAVAQTDDFYACSVMKYVKHFTGHETKFFDPAEEGEYAAYDQPFDKNLRDFIFELSSELKVHQDPKKTWQRIFNNKIFLNPEQGVFEEVE